MIVPQQVISEARATRTANGFRMPSGAYTDVDPSLWIWACGPGVGDTASCVSVPEPQAAPQLPPASGIMPAPIAPAPRVVRLDVEAENKQVFEPWDSCRETAVPLAVWAESLPCRAATAAGLASQANSPGAAAWFGCLLFGIAALGAVADVFGGRR